MFGFKDTHRDPCLCQFQRCAETGKAPADNSNVKQGVPHELPVQPRRLNACFPIAAGRLA